MSFIHEVDSLRTKLHLSSVNPFVLLGIVLLIFVIAGFAVFACAPYFFNDKSNDALSYQTAQEADNEKSNFLDNEKQEEKLFVHVGGAVISPGLYELPKGSRVKDAIDAAGGLTETANIDSVNLAESIVDGMHLVVSDSAQSSQSLEASQTSGGGGKVNLNSASLAELTTLDGIGEATAQKIIAYRESQGRFGKIEDLKKVSGIGDKKFEAIKDMICV